MTTVYQENKILGLIIIIIIIIMIIIIIIIIIIIMAYTAAFPQGGSPSY